MITDKGTAAVIWSKVGGGSNVERYPALSRSGKTVFLVRVRRAEGLEGDELERIIGIAREHGAVAAITEGSVVIR